MAGDLEFVKAVDKRQGKRSSLWPRHNRDNGLTVKQATFALMWLHHQAYAFHGTAGDRAMRCKNCMNSTTPLGNSVRAWEP